MTNEEFERTKEFIINQQAQFTVDIEKLKETQERIQKTQAQTEVSLLNLVNVTHQYFRFTVKSLAALGDAQKRTDENLNVLANAQLRTNEHLDTLIATVDRHIREGHQSAET